MDSGVFKRGKLLESMSRADLDGAIADGRFRQIRHGWLATPSADPDVVRAVSVGGVLTCASALRRHGAWVVPTTKLHVRGSTSSVRNHPAWCRQHGRPPTVTDAVDDLPTALRHAARCLPTEEFVVICDSLLNRGLLTPSALDAELGGAPRSVQQALTLVDGRSESGTETLVRLRMRAPHLNIRTQVAIPEVGRVDLMIGSSMIIEVDGYEYHADPHQFERDRLRDLQARALGYDPVRLTYRQVIYQWDRVVPLLGELLRRDLHRRPPIDTHP
ncbi:endonuclease domain-containing protein [Gordonia sp. (in: high G+C Gram-positive bacteria)]|uniref:endonuclease domain-containing protein n=1 Tax=Gordonia sp. (in: high G+C Gram-positive bacteria) TaxID=84139 RepID=UPI003C769048